ncbi:MAG: cell division protein ZapA [Desulfovibrio sp.]|jgi:cell division protein ZapA|nr:cell division protein ZapA [Desulfovibrio sp.]
MHSHTLEVLGFELSFKAEADSGRIGKAKELLDERYERLVRHGGSLGKEKLLAFLALSLADDVLVMRQEKHETERRIRELLGKIEKVEEHTTR